MALSSWKGVTKNAATSVFGYYIWAKATSSCNKVGRMEFFVNENAV
jgi:hypothetical protein